MLGCSAEVLYQVVCGRPEKTVGLLPSKVESRSEVSFNGNSSVFKSTWMQAGRVSSWIFMGE